LFREDRWYQETECARGGYCVDFKRPADTEQHRETEREEEEVVAEGRAAGEQQKERESDSKAIASQTRKAEAEEGQILPRRQTEARKDSGGVAEPSREFVETVGGDRILERPAEEEYSKEEGQRGFASILSDARTAKRHQGEWNDTRLIPGAPPDISKRESHAKPCGSHTEHVRVTPSPVPARMLQRGHRRGRTLSAVPTMAQQLGKHGASVGSMPAACRAPAVPECLRAETRNLVSVFSVRKHAASTQLEGAYPKAPGKHREEYRRRLEQRRTVRSDREVIGWWRQLFAKTRGGARQSKQRGGAADSQESAQR
jgi:hypothetical protein